ncbi:hypothetical protein VNO77_05300 [Canavalia gladiata]|uniref:Uncharacterized protein n=1 Tax=Canavalia gladiata TaxID=3824 RepID=A0AAN9R9V8_CANGL
MGKKSEARVRQIQEGGFLERTNSSFLRENGCQVLPKKKSPSSIRSLASRITPPLLHGLDFFETDYCSHSMFDADYRLGGTTPLTIKGWFVSLRVSFFDLTGEGVWAFFRFLATVGIAVLLSCVLHQLKETQPISITINSSMSKSTAAPTLFISGALLRDEFLSLFLSGLCSSSHPFIFFFYSSVFSSSPYSLVLNAQKFRVVLRSGNTLLSIQNFHRRGATLHISSLLLTL